MNEIEKLQKIIDESTNIVFFGGAGVSTESGIKDFRSQDGLYNEKYLYSPEEILSHDFFFSHPKEFYEFYFSKMINENVSPNIAHYKLAELEKKHKLKAIITQNIDGLHQKAGSKIVYELHGTVYKNRCCKCHKFYSLDDILKLKPVPYCSCGGLIKPEVVLYQEPLDQNTLIKAIEAIENCSTLIIAGTSLSVYPAASLIDFFKGKNLVLINKTSTPKDNMATLVIHQKVGEVLSKINI